MNNSGWDTTTLEEAIDRIIDYRGKTPEKTTSGIPLITAKIVKNGFIQSPTEFIAEANYDDWMVRGLPQIGDVLLTMEAPLGEVAQITDVKVALAQRLVAIRGKKGVLNNSFLKYFLRSEQGQNVLRQRESGTTVLGIKQSELRKIKIPIPPFSEQCAIADVLTALDDKIELNRQMNKTLEQLAQALFKHLFLDNPDYEQWEEKPLTDLIEINPYRKISSSDSIPYLDMANIPTQGHRAIEWIYREFRSGSKFINGDTLLARITPCLENGKTAFVDFLEDGQTGWGSTEFIVLHPIEPLPPEFGYFLARSKEFRKFAIQNMSGTTGRQRVPNTCFSNYLIANPPEQISKYFGSQVKNIMNLIKENDNQSRTLKELRDILLPKLMSGKVRVKMS